MELHILSAIKKYANSRPIKFHMPGHIGDKKFSKIFKGADLDVTELEFIDNENAIKRAEDDVKNIMGAKFCRFLTGGATSGILSMAYAVKDNGNSIIIPRGAHKSVYNAMELVGINPIIVPDYDGDSDSFINAVKENLNKDGVIGAFLTYPDYYGRTFDILKISNIIKEKSKLLLIDNAHGGHFKFVDTTYAGDVADCWVDGLHKNFCTLNQGAVVYSNNPDLFDALDEGVSKFSTTSPSYPLLSSIEYGVKFMGSVGKEKLNKTISCIAKVKEDLLSLGVTILDNNDPLKLWLDFSKLGVSAIDVEKVFEKAGIFCEMMDGKTLLLMVSVLTPKSWFKNLIGAVKKIKTATHVLDDNQTPADILTKKLDYLDAVKSQSEWVELDKSLGRICAKNAGLFPPCKPTVVAGEIIDDKAICQLKKKNTFGLKDGRIKVVKE